MYVHQDYIPAKSQPDQKKLILDEHNYKRESKKSIERDYTGTFSCTTTYISSANNSPNKTSIEYDIEEALDIKEEIIQVPEKTTVNEWIKTEDIKLCTAENSSAVICTSKNELRPDEKHEIQESNPEKKHTCEKCGRSYRRRQGLYSHQKFECNVNPQFLCKFCNKRFAHKFRMVRHVDQTSKSGYKCDECPRSYTWLSGLSRHKRSVHVAVKPQFTCDFCGHQANQKSSLSRHIASHHLK
ncbi:zinc finger protein 254-like [Belonocnema kinseyi]|uniref:zinc finger protein 254-like n=1 Tax=Belonocnema kinseyi TaxID=2817044 RepID=UPI00143E01C2|nr:zinc finger protein 254-like [Belonocnema kinseyi]